MSYIGKEPQTGAYSMLDALTASATASYSLTLDSVAFVPESANHLLVSLNGSIQKAGSSYTVSGSTLTFSSTLASSDSIDFVLALGNVLDIGTPSDATVTNAKTNFVSTSSSAGLQIKGDNTTGGTLQLNCEQNSHGIKLRSPAHSAGQSYTLTFPTGNVTADRFLKVDSVSGSGTTGIGQLSFAEVSTVGNSFFASKQSGTQTVGSATQVKVTFDNELFDSNSKYDTSNSRYTPAVAGKYLITAGLSFSGTGDSNYIIIFIYKNGSEYTKSINRSPSTNDNGVVITSLVELDDDDYIEIYCKQNTGSDQLVASSSSDRTTFFGGVKVD